MQPPVEVPAGSPVPARPKSKNNVALIVVLTSCGCAFLMIPILAAILFPVFAQARAKARTATCISNVKQMSLGVLMYAQDYDEKYPAAKEWMTVTEAYTRNPAANHCPAVSAETGADGNPAYGYAYNAQIDKAGIADFDAPQNTILMYDSSTLTPNAFDELTSLPTPPRHSNRNVIGLLDGHCRAMTSDEFGALLQSAPPANPTPERDEAK